MSHRGSKTGTVVVREVDEVRDVEDVRVLVSVWEVELLVNVEEVSESDDVVSVYLRERTK